MKRAEYKYQVEEVVNDTLKIVNQTRTLPNKRNKTEKAYEVQSLVYPDAPNYIITEISLKRGDGCAYKRGLRVYEGNSLYSVEHIRSYLIDINEAKSISKKSSKKIKMKCPNCEMEKIIAPCTLQNQGFGCTTCSKGTSYPELFMMAYLEVKEIEYEYQKVFDDLPNRRFDFYLPKENRIIETHGKQHYENSGSMYDYKKISESDDEKKRYCKLNSISYVEVDARESSFNYLKGTINKSILSDINKEEEKLIISQISKNKKYPIKEIISLYKEGYSCKTIGDRHNLKTQLIWRILKKTNTPITGYNDRGNNRCNRTRIRCITTGELFKSITEASNKYKLHVSNIVNVCNGKRKTSGKHPITGEKLTWEYVVEQKEINTYSKIEENLHIA